MPAAMALCLFTEYISYMSPVKRYYPLQLWVINFILPGMVAIAFQKKKTARGKTMSDNVQFVVYERNRKIFEMSENKIQYCVM